MPSRDASIARDVTTTRARARARRRRRERANDPVVDAMNADERECERERARALAQDEKTERIVKRS